MSTHGNMDGIFRGSHCSELKEPTIYEVPQELLDADPNFALLIEEANNEPALACGRTAYPRHDGERHIRLSMIHY